MGYLLAADTERVPKELGAADLLQLAAAGDLRERFGAWPPIAQTWSQALCRPRRRIFVDLSRADPLAAHGADFARARPLALIAGLLAAVAAIEAEEVIFGLPAADPVLPPRLRALLKAGLGDVPWRAVFVAATPVAALDESLAALALGAAPVPTQLQAGAAGTGVVVHRPETLVQLARLLAVGPERFRREETFLARVSSESSEPVLRELRLGTPLRQALYGLKGSALLIGSALSSPIRYQPDLPLAPEALALSGAALGGGGMELLPVRPEPALRRHLDVLSQASCGQCPSCAMASLRIRHSLRAPDLEDGLRTARHARGKGLCPLLDALCDTAISLVAGASENG